MLLDYLSGTYPFSARQELFLSGKCEPKSRWNGSNSPHNRWRRNRRLFPPSRVDLSVHQSKGRTRQTKRRSIHLYPRGSSSWVDGAFHLRAQIWKLLTWCKHDHRPYLSVCLPQSLNRLVSQRQPVHNPFSHSQPRYQKRDSCQFRFRLLYCGRSIVRGIQWKL